MNVKVREIKYGSEEYILETELRDRVLRRPLGLKLKLHEMQPEENDIHLGAFSEYALVACLILTDVGERRSKMRQVAVEDSLQGTGVGRKLVEFSECVARERGFEEFVLHARDSAVPFYLKLGYEIFDEPFTEVGIPHRKMRKRIAG